jgi:hypothetical protein
MASDGGELIEGRAAYDTRLRRWGQVIEILGELVAIRPVDGGLFWTASRRDVRPATDAEAARVGLPNGPQVMA